MSYLIRAPRRGGGYTRLAGPGTAGLRHLEFGIVELPAGATQDIVTGDREAVVYLLTGAGTVTDGGRGGAARLGPRQDVFREPPSAVYLPPGTSAHLAASGGGFFGAVVWGASASRAPFRAIGPGDVERRDVGAGNWRRVVYNVVDAARGAERLLVGETVNPPGNWSSYPPHKHDTRSASGELPMEEVYFYLVQPEGGFGLQMLYTPPGAADAIDAIYRVHSGDLLVIPRGYHPVVAAAGYGLFYLWAMAGDESRYGAWSDDPAYAWVRRLEHDPPAGA